MISVSTRKSSDIRKDLITTKPALCDQAQLTMVRESGLNNKSINKMPSTENKEKKRSDEVQNIENDDEERDDLGKCFGF